MINDEIITREKLLQYDEVIGIETWEEVAKIVDTTILGEMDWYLIDGLMNDYLLCTHVEESKPFLEDMEKIGLDSQEIFFKQALNATRDFFENILALKSQKQLQK